MNANRRLVSAAARVALSAVLIVHFGVGVSRAQDGEKLEVFVCEESKLWERPSDEQQERRFARYRRYRNQAILESVWWVRDFIFYQGHESDRELEVYDLSGAWAAPDETRHCNDADWRRQIEENLFLELWVFNHELLTVVREANVYTVTVEPTGKGYQLVRFRRPEEGDAGSIRLVVVTPSGEELETLTENAGTPPKGHVNSC